MSSALLKFFTVAAYEWADSFRSKRALILLILYLMGSIGSCLIFINILHRVEMKTVEAVGLTPSDKPGATTRTLWKSPQFEDLISKTLGDRELARKLLSIPPIALFYSWLALSFTPLLVVFLTSSRIAEEVSTASVRFQLFRTHRATWCLGKLAGQALMLMLALILSGVGTWTVAWFRMKYFDPGPTAWHIFLFSLKAWVYAMSYMGMALGISQLFRSPILATAFALLGMIVLSTIAAVSAHLEKRGNLALWSTVHNITPNGHVMELWNPDPTHYLSASMMLLVLCFAYFFGGYVFFVRRDQ